MNTREGNVIVQLVKGKEIEIRLDSDLDGNAIDELKACLDRRIQDGIQKIVIDFANVEFLSSAGIGVIFSRQRRIRQTGGEISLKNISDEIKFVLDEIGLLTQFHII